MEKRELGKTGFEISAIAFDGIMVLGMDQEESADIVAEAVASGVDYFDAAPGAGDAQEALGPALAPHRKSVYLASRTDKRTAKEAQEDLEESLRALRTDYLDVYQLSGLDDPDDIATAFGPGGAMEALAGAVEKGYVRSMGFTCRLDASAKAIMEQSGAFSTMQFPVNFAHSFKKRGGVDAIALCRGAGVGVVAVEALALRRWLDGEARNYPNCWYRPIYDDLTLAQLALNFAITQEVATAIPPGDKRLFRLALDIIEEQGGKARPLSPEEHTQLRRKAHEIQDVVF